MQLVAAPDAERVVVLGAAALRPRRRMPARAPDPLQMPPAAEADAAAGEAAAEVAADVAATQPWLPANTPCA